MAIDNYIPAGRTSLIKQGDLDLQIQTEYATRPHPRITTAIAASGQVIQKIERKLDNPIRSEEEQMKVQRTIVQQHAEVINLIEERAAKANSNNKISPPKVDHRLVPDKADQEAEPTMGDRRVVPDHRVVPDKSPELVSSYQSMPDRLMDLPGVRWIYRLNNDGEFLGDGNDRRFKKTYRKIFKNLADLMELYSREQGGMKRSVGVYEIQRDKLYFASSGLECYFIIVERPRVDFDYEAEIKEIITG